MKHLLLNRFKGALLGGNIIYIDRQKVTPNQLVVETTPALMTGISRLISREKFDPEQWAKNVFIDIPSPEQALVAMLPLMLFFHDDRIKLRQMLTTVSNGWQLDWETCSSAVAIGYIISRSLTESFNSQAIITQLLDEMSNLHPLLVKELSTIIPWIGSANDRLFIDSSACLEDRAHSLQQLTQKLITNPHPIITSTVDAMYCALSTPEDFSVATRRADRRSQLSCALTGILAGAQNSLTGIPLNGDLATHDRTQWLIAAENLLAAWAGVYQFQLYKQGIGESQ